MVELPHLTWRKFLVLVRCLSPNSATATRLRAQQFIGTGSGRHRGRDEVVEVKGAKAAQRAFDMLFKPERKEPTA